MAQREYMDPEPRDFGRVNTYYLLAVAVVCLVSDGWSGKPSPLLHQLLLLPASLGFALILWQLLYRQDSSAQAKRSHADLPRFWALTLGVFQLLSIAMMAAESRHFARFGYRLSAAPTVVLAAAAFLAMSIIATSARRRGVVLLGTALTLYAAGMALAIADFPLNYLRSDMLPVIAWADGRLWHHLNPYATIHVGSRLYDFPYLPGMLVAYLPAVAFGVDLRFATLSYLGATALLLFGATKVECRIHASALIGAFVLCPFLQYRHDLYLQPHWFALAAAVVLMQKRRFAWSGVLWGASCAIYQLSWVIVPFFFLNAWRRRGLPEAMKMIVWTALGFLAIAGPFLPFALRQVASNTVGQWSHLQHALADPMNLSYWLTFLVHPDHLRWVQAGVLTTLFLVSVIREGCFTLVDTLRYMVLALTLFISMNVLVDGYFYLTLLLLLLMYVCVAEDLWSPASQSEPA